MTDHYTIEVFWSEEDEGFIAVALELEGCSAWGASREEALKEINIAIDLWLKAAREIGKPIPEPNPPVHS